MHQAAAGDRATVLVVDDDPKIVRLVRASLQPAGFEVLSAGDGEAGIAMVEAERPDLVILDRNMPRLDGLSACTRIRELSDVPVLMLTALSTETDRVAGLEGGADDYVVKPFSPIELLARVRALLRRARPAGSSEAAAFDDGVLVVDIGRRAVRLSGEPVDLTRTEWRLVSTLVGYPGRVFLHDELKRRVWGEHYGASDELLRAFVRSLRRKIEPDPAEPRYVRTQPGVGYVFRPPRPAEVGRQPGAAAPRQA
jgi:DNA-binding response OmpR family regulator